LNKYIYTPINDAGSNSINNVQKIETGVQCNNLSDSNSNTYTWLKFKTVGSDESCSAIGQHHSKASQKGTVMNGLNKNTGSVQLRS
jgi:hypothetical protein